ncbi:MAG: hypothetical protein IKQ99_02270 [Alphaproteobacteria bacterium]|nr:hypothetical protein [Alphaproteobacteria bacterium]
MNKSAQKNFLKIQKILIGFLALATVFSVSSAAFATNTASKAMRTAGAVLSGLGLGMTLGGYLSNPYRKRERD